MKKSFFLKLDPFKINWLHLASDYCARISCTGVYRGNPMCVRTYNRKYEQYVGMFQVLTENNLLLCARLRMTRPAKGFFT